MNAAQNRYRVTLKSESSHCCFKASVIDTQRPHEFFVHKQHTVCECFDVEDARLICEALACYKATRHDDMVGG